MKKVIELADLIQLGATKRQQNGYNGTDPLAIYQDDDGSYIIKDADGTHKNQTLRDVFDELDVYGYENDDEDEE